MSGTSQVPPFLPVLLGSDVDVYSLARAFHQAHGVRSLVVAGAPRGPILNSRILDFVQVADSSSGPALVADLIRIAATRAGAGTRPVLMVMADHHLDMVDAHRAELAEHFLLPYASATALARVREKSALEQACSELAIPYPRTVVLTGSQTDPNLPDGFTFPAVVKASDSAEWTLATVPGKRKAYFAADADAVRTILATVRGAGFAGELLVQEAVRGDDTYGRSITLYRSQQGEVPFAVAGSFLLEMHQPARVGNAAAILTTPNPLLVDQAVAVAEHLGLTGYVNIDFKIDSRDGVARLLDVNPRMGRQHHHLLIAGVDVTGPVVEEYVHGIAPRRQVAHRVGVLSYLPRLVVLRYLRDGALRRRVWRAWDARISHPLKYRADRNPRRWFYRISTQAKLVRTFAQTYPRPTEFGL